MIQTGATETVSLVSIDKSLHDAHMICQTGAKDVLHLGNERAQGIHVVGHV